jgi:hypothetical protein
MSKHCLEWHLTDTASYSGKNAAAQVGWNFLWVVFFGLAATGIAGYAVYKYRIRVYDMNNLLHVDYQFVRSRSVPSNFLSAALHTEVHGFRDPRNHGAVHAPGQPRRSL